MQRASIQKSILLHHAQISWTRLTTGKGNSRWIGGRLRDPRTRVARSAPPRGIPPRSQTTRPCMHPRPGVVCCHPLENAPISTNIPN
jgi:hypothetical protein